MLERPDIPDELVITHLREEYDLRVAALIFLPLGADMGTAVYRAVADDGMAYFLKLRKGFNKITVTVPLFLKSQGIEAIIVPFETRSKRHWGDFGEYKMILYPFIEGDNGFETRLYDEHRRSIGVALKRIHTAPIPTRLKRQIPKETFSASGRQLLKLLQARVESQNFNDPVAAKLAEFMKLKRNEISHLIGRAEELASKLQSGTLELVLCHADVHA